MGLSITPLTGSALAAALPALARLRIEVFRDWPYLYDGTLAYEQGYLARFAAAEGAVIVAAADDREIVGVATGSPLATQDAAVAAAFAAIGHDAKRVFYFGESVLRPGYRGRGVGHAFFDHREAHARGLGGFTHAAFCAVVRPADHPLRPPGYVALDAFWTRRGYAKVEGLVTSFSWTDLGDTAETPKPMQFWMRALDPPAAG